MAGVTIGYVYEKNLFVYLAHLFYLCGLIVILDLDY